MAAKLITLEEAAQRLGISPADLNALREKHEVHAYRDGMSWKFKEDEIDRVKADLADRLAGHDSGDLLDLPIDLDEPISLTSSTSTEDADDDMVLASEIELGESNPSTSSTIIGRPGQQNPSESDIRITAAEELGSDVKLVPDVDDPGSSGVRVVPAGRKPTKGDSHLGLASDSSPVIARPEAPAAKTPPAAKAKPGAAKTAAVAKPKAPAPVDDEFALLDDAGGPTRPGGGSEIRLDEDSSADEFVLQGPGSDVTKASVADSGISLADPADSGLSLEVPLDLGSAPGEMLELGGEEDSDFQLLEDSSADTEAVGEMHSDDEFLLTPLGEEGSDESSDDSGSQVIALDSAEDFSDSAAMLGESPASPLDMVGTVDEGDLSGDFSSPAMGLSPAGGVAVMPSRAADAIQFSGLWITAMVFCVLFLLLGGMMTYDLMRNMWSWNGTYSVNSSIMQFIVDMVGL